MDAPRAATARAAGMSESRLLPSAMVAVARTARKLTAWRMFAMVNCFFVFMSVCVLFGLLCFREREGAAEVNFVNVD